MVAEYLYTDADGKPLYIKQRLWPKAFRQYVPRPGGGKEWSLNGVQRVLFHLPQLIEAKACGEVIYLVEGEEDVLALERAGVAATTWTEGAWRPGQKSKWRAEYSRTLIGVDVIIVRDRDNAGRHTVKDIAADLQQHAASVKIAEAAEGKDARDHLEAGHNVDEFVPVDDSDDEPSILNQLAQQVQNELPAPSAPMRVAHVLIEDHKYDGELTLRHWRNGWMQWQSTHWIEAEDKAIRSWLYERLEGAKSLHVQPADADSRWNQRAEAVESEPPQGRRRVRSIGCRSAHRGRDRPAGMASGPQWSAVKPYVYRAWAIVACSNGLLHIGTRKLLELTPLFFNRVAVPFEYEPTAPEPMPLAAIPQPALARRPRVDQRLAGILRLRPVRPNRPAQDHAPDRSHPFRQGNHRPSSGRIVGKGQPRRPNLGVPGNQLRTLTPVGQAARRRV